MPPLAGRNLNPRQTPQHGYDEVPGTSTGAPTNESVKTTYNKPSATQATPRVGKPISLRYPLENQDRYAASIKFEVHSVDPYLVDAAGAQSLMKNRFLGQMIGAATGGVSESQATKASKDEDAAAHDAAIAKAKKDNQDAVQSGGITNRDLGMTTKPLNRVAKLYFPLAVQQTDTAQYTEANLGTGGATALGALSSGSSLMRSLYRGSTEGLVDVFNLVKGQASQEAAQLAAARIVQKFQGSGLGQAAQIGLQVRINPNSRTMFQGVTLRQFSFLFKFIAKSANEAEEIRQLIKLFRSELYPESLGSRLGLPLGYKFPNLFKITYQYNDRANPFMPQPLMCYLRDVNTTYNPTSMSWHEDGAPSEVDMTLSFQEFRGLTKNDIINGSDGAMTYGGPH